MLLRLPDSKDKSSILVMDGLAKRTLNKQEQKQLYFIDAFINILTSSGCRDKIKRDIVRDY